MGPNSPSAGACGVQPVSHNATRPISVPSTSITTRRVQESSTFFVQNLVGIRTAQQAATIRKNSVPSSVKLCPCQTAAQRAVPRPAKNVVRAIDPASSPKTVEGERTPGVSGGVVGRGRGTGSGGASVLMGEEA